MKRLITAGATDQTVYVFIQDSASTTGAGKTGLAYNTASLVCYYVRDLAAAAALTLATQTVTGAHSDGGFVEVSATNMPGIYRLDLSDAVCAAGVSNVALMLQGAAGMVPLPLEIQLAGGQIGAITGNTAQTGDAYARLGAPAGASVSADVAEIKSETGSLYSNLSGNGYFDDMIGAIIAASAPSAGTIIAGVWDEAIAGHLIAGTTGKKLSDAGALGTPLDAAGVRAAVGLAAANLDSQIAAIPDVGENAVSVRAELTDELALINTNLDTKVSTVATYVDTEVAAIYSRLGAPAGLSMSADLAAVKVDTAAVKAKTDNLPAAPASTTNITTVGAIGTGGIAAASFAAGAIDAAAIATDAIGALELAAGAASEVATAVRTELATELGRISGDAFARLGAPTGASVSADIAAVKAETAVVNTATGAAAIRTALGLASANLDTQLVTIDDLLDTEIGAIKAKTDLIPAAPASTTNITAAAGIALSAGERTTLADAIFDRTDGATSGYTLREALEVMLSVLAGKLSGAATATITVRDINDTKNVVVATTDSSGNRTAVTITP